MKKLRLKAILSSLLILVFLFLAFSGALLYFNKTGMVLGMPRGSLRDAHTVAAACTCVLIIAHVILNRRVYRRELESLAKRADTGDNGGSDK